jgi:CBS domain-containing protein
MVDQPLSNRKLVRDLMKVGVATCPASAPAVDVARLLLEQNLEAVVVLDEDGHGVGVVSQDELVKLYTGPDALTTIRSMTAEQIMREGVPEVPPDIPLSAAAQLMRDQKLRMVFLMHNSGGIAYPAAALSYQHLLRHLTADSNAELSDLGVQAARKTPMESFIERRDAARRKNQAPK